MSAVSEQVLRGKSAAGLARPARKGIKKDDAPGCLHRNYIAYAAHRLKTDILFIGKKWR
jgi:hypothetical protein